MQTKNSLLKHFFILVVNFVSFSLAAQKLQPLDTTAIEKITGVKGKSNHGEYKITIPQNDLNVEVDGFKIIPPMGLGTWIAFTPTKNGAMIMGDVVLTENDLKPVQQEVIKQGLTITAIHNHFIRNHPNILYGASPRASVALLLCSSVPTKSRHRDAWRW